MGHPAAIPYPDIDPVLVVGPISSAVWADVLIGLTAAYFLIQHKVARKGLAIRKIDLRHGRLRGLRRFSAGGSAPSLQLFVL